ncbi:MAG: tetratricopeptide repeat protein [Chlorobi bacterium]|nr:tetratricopeptide repeat protein [Chlorobiota bacterium]
MSEMLGNQYFMARNYVNAIRELEPVYMKDPQNKPVRRKLIICYVQTRIFDKALDVFHSLVKDDVSFITSADSVLDDCPCDELLGEYDETHNFTDEYEFNLSHGMLWLYCDANKSFKYLKKAFKMSPHNEKLKKSIKIIDKYRKSVHVH